MKISRNLVLEGMGNFGICERGLRSQKKKRITPLGRSMRECWSRSCRLKDVYV